MKFHRKHAAIYIALVAPIFTYCSNGVGSGSGASTMSNPGMDGMGGMDSKGMPLAVPAEPPDDPISFANDIQPIFDLRCTRCHQPPNPTGGLDLTQGNSYNNLVNVPTSAACRQQVPDSVRVASCDTPPCDPSQSMIWAKTMPDAPPPDGRRCRGTMPLGGIPLGQDCHWDFHLIEQWIIEGAHNN